MLTQDLSTNNQSVFTENLTLQQLIDRELRTIDGLMQKPLFQMTEDEAEDLLSATKNLMALSHLKSSVAWEIVTLDRIHQAIKDARSFKDMAAALRLRMLFMGEPEGGEL